MNLDEMWELDFWEMMLRTTISFFVLLILARLMGKKQISQLTFFHYATGITIGSIAADIAGESETPFLNGLIAMIWWALLTILMNYISLKSKKIRVLLDDQPTIVMHGGKLLEKGMKKARLDLNELNMMLREQGVFSIKDVDYAILETNGNLSILKKAGLEPATKKDVNAPITQPKYIPTEIISDSKIVQKNLKELGLTEEWVYEQLKKQGIGRIEQVYYAEIQADGSLHVDTLAAEKKEKAP
ncbi:YetF domain-containing protein [Sporosarcina soli]|uniref:YetF domain-containing protein n=1 Tax=Sporosarcina soli TaxID=334736 RepID=A0ABW0TNY1_9BACL